MGRHCDTFAIFVNMIFWSEKIPPKKAIDNQGRNLVFYAALMGQQLRKRAKRARRDAYKKRIHERLRAGKK